MKQVTFWDGIVDLDTNEVFFHGVRGGIFQQLQGQAEEGQIVLWGRNESEDDEWHERGKGEVSVSSFDGMSLSINEFYDEDGMIFIVAGGNPRQLNDEEYLIDVSESRIVGGLRPTDDPEVFNLFSMQEMMDI